MRDAVTGQYYLRARFYNPVIARFLSEDTYYGDGLNLYAYCHNNPVRYVDPSGHIKKICSKKYAELKQKEAEGGKLSLKEKYQIYEYEHRKTQPDGGGSDSKSGRSATFYKNNPMDNPKAARDIIENPNAVYGFSPNPESTRIGKYANKIDWTNPEQVAIARQTRKAYHDANESMLQSLYDKGYTTQDIAKNGRRKK